MLVLIGKVLPAQSVKLVLAAAPIARVGIATILSITLSDNAVAVVSKRERPLPAIATEIAAAPATSPTAKTSIATITSIMLNPA
ncbi:MAG TPA: hypothetical protein VJN64_15385, partial [Terriglobales bacterium]|nr:hypothetical protein [Terriglobales bacterium]